MQAARAASFCPTCVTSDDDYENFAGTVLAKQCHRAHHPVQRHGRGLALQRQVYQSVQARFAGAATVRSVVRQDAAAVALDKSMELWETRRAQVAAARVAAEARAAELEVLLRQQPGNDSDQ